MKKYPWDMWLVYAAIIIVAGALLAAWIYFYFRFKI